MRPRLIAPLLAGVTALTVLTGAGTARADDIALAQAQVAALSAEVARVATELTEGTRRLEQGRAHLAEMRRSAGAARRASDAARVAAAQAKQRLAQAVAAAYRAARPTELGFALAAQPEQLRAAVLASADLDHVQGSQQDLLQEATKRAEEAQSLLRRAEQLESDARAQAVALQAQVDALRTQAQQSQQSLEAAAQRLQAAQEARRREAERKVAEAAAAAAAAAREQGPGALTPTPAPLVVPAGAATCKGTSTAGYANGFLPPEALCPIDVGNGHRLRADAAAAINALGKEWEQGKQEPGRQQALCVTDSYRSYPEQVSVYGRKPGLAAIPGTSNHGLGIALDFCGGVETFDSPAHLWMKVNAPRFGWVHPAWAEPGGSRPEPWHWEFVGVQPGAPGSTPAAAPAR